MIASLGAMREHGVVLAVASGPINNLQRWKRAAKDRIIGGAYTGPHDPLSEISRLRELIGDKQIGVLGELGLQYRDIAPIATANARAGARSVEVRASVSKLPAAGSFTAQFDDVTLTSPSILFNGFD